MAYSDFTLRKFKKDFGLQIDEQRNLFSSIPALTCSDYLVQTLQENVSLAIAINTEKARSEMMISPVLLEVRRRAAGTLSLFSGTESNVDSDRGLNGYCNYILSRSREQLTSNSPISVIVEAKNESIKEGLGQCAAEMFATQILIGKKEPRLM